MSGHAKSFGVLWTKEEEALVYKGGKLNMDVVKRLREEAESGSAGADKKQAPTNAELKEAIFSKFEEAGILVTEEDEKIISKMTKAKLVEYLANDDNFNNPEK